MNELPTSFGKYLLTEKIATGGMAEIYLAKLIGPGGFEKQLVIKQIHPELSGQRQFVDLFVAEAKTLVSLSHGNIVPVYELGVVDNMYFIAMEYIDGPTLYQLQSTMARREAAMSPPEAAYISAEILKGLDYAHRKNDGVIHRDLSPRNVMLSREGEVKIVDFGIAVSRDQQGSDTTDRTPVGSYPYMSPEQVHSQRLTEQSDIFSAGVLLWEMLTGARLFARASADETLKAVAAAVIEAPSRHRPGVPAVLDTICLRALARDREQRYANASACLADIQHYLYSLDTPISPATVSRLVALHCPAEIRRSSALPEPAPVAPSSDASIPGTKPLARAPGTDHGNHPSTRPLPGRHPRSATSGPAPSSPAGDDRHSGRRRATTAQTFATHVDIERVLARSTAGAAATGDTDTDAKADTDTEADTDTKADTGVATLAASLSVTARAPVEAETAAGGEAETAAGGAGATGRADGARDRPTPTAGRGSAGADAAGAQSAAGASQPAANRGHVATGRWRRAAVGVGLVAVAGAVIAGWPRASTPGPTATSAGDAANQAEIGTSPQQRQGLGVVTDAGLTMPLAALPTDAQSATAPVATSDISTASPKAALEPSRYAQGSAASPLVPSVVLPSVTGGAPSKPTASNPDRARAQPAGEPQAQRPANLPGKARKSAITAPGKSTGSAAGHSVATPPGKPATRPGAQSSGIQRAPRDRRVPARGRLKVGANPWGEVYLDGRKLGRTPNAWSVSAGKHLVEVVFPVGERPRRRRFEVDIAPGETESLGVVDFRNGEGSWSNQPPGDPGSARIEDAVGDTTRDVPE